MLQSVLPLMSLCYRYSCGFVKPFFVPHLGTFLTIYFFNHIQPTWTFFASISVQRAWIKTEIDNLRL